MQDLSCYKLWDTLAGHLLRKQVFFLRVSKYYIFLLPQGKRNSLFFLLFKMWDGVTYRLLGDGNQLISQRLVICHLEGDSQLGQRKALPLLQVPTGLLWEVDVLTWSISSRLCRDLGVLGVTQEAYSSRRRSGSWTEHLFTACSLAWVSLKYVRGAWQLQHCDHREQCGSQLNCAAMCSVSLLQHWGSSGQRVDTSWASFICTNPLVPSFFLPSQLCP